MDLLYMVQYNTRFVSMLLKVLYYLQYGKLFCLFFISTAAIEVTIIKNGQKIFDLVILLLEI